MNVELICVGTEILLGNEEKEALERALGYSSGTILGKKE